MPASATLEYPKYRDSEPGTKAVPVAWEDSITALQMPRAAVTRAQSLQAHVGKLGQLFALIDPIASPKSAVEEFAVKPSFREYPSQQTASSPARTALIAWLLDLRAWGVETEQLKASVRDLLNLKRGWDGEDAEPISPHSIEHACAFIDALGSRSKDFEPFPDPDGLVGLEAHKKDKVAYLSFYEDGLIAYVFRANEAVHRGNKSKPDAVIRVLNAVL